MKMMLLRVVAAGILLLIGSPAARAAGVETKVQVCHSPRGRPGASHTITVGANALRAHLAHGDRTGPCAPAGEWEAVESCGSSCDDGNACTVDRCRRVCFDRRCRRFNAACSPDHPPVDCDDGDACTTDGCDPATGCLNAPVNCDDGDGCTLDLCDSGRCLHPAIDCGPGGVCDPDSGSCIDPCDGVVCQPVDDCHAPGTCVVVDGLPECIGGEAVDDGAACSDGNNDTVNDVCQSGTCSGTPASCPCWDGDLRIPVGFGALGGFNPFADPEPICGYPPPPADEWEVFCRDPLTDVRYAHPDMCADLVIYGSIVQLRYFTTDMPPAGKHCEARIEDAGFYSMFLLRSWADGLTQQEFDDCTALLRQVFTCP